MTIDSIIELLLQSRGIAHAQDFFHPKHPNDLVSPFDSQPAIDLITDHVKQNNKIAIYGDYDVDGICSTAILWETLYADYRYVFPHIPHRGSEGYGLSKKGIDHCIQEGAKLIIAVDNGIVAHDQVAYCRSLDCDIIIIDHHQPEDKFPNANVILYSPDNCAAGLSWFFTRDYLHDPDNEKLSLVAIATICDIVPLTGSNRSFVKHGLSELNNTNRPGLLSLREVAHISNKQIGTYEVGFILGPRINAAGRLEHAIDSLRLLCTKDSTKAVQLAKFLDDTNSSRQQATQEAVDYALAAITETDILVSASPGYHEGVIGLVAAKLTEKYHHPSIVISIGETMSKASARSIPGFHITDHIRKFNHLLAGVGGHAMAAGFSVDNKNLPELLSLITKADIASDLLVKKQRVDLEIPLDAISQELFARLEEFQPFGMGNPQPVFLSKDVPIHNIRKVGRTSQHLKFKTGDLDAIWFSAPADYTLDTKPYDLIYSLAENTYNGSTTLQLIIKGVQD